MKANHTVRTITTSCSVLVVPTASSRSQTSVFPLSATNIIPTTSLVLVAARIWLDWLTKKMKAMSIAPPAKMLASNEWLQRRKYVESARNQSLESTLPSVDRECTQSTIDVKNVDVNSREEIAWNMRASYTA
jgi:hypothetical protein